MNKKKALTYIAWLAAIIILLSYLTYIVFVATNPDRAKEIIEKSVREEVAKISIPEATTLDGYTPRKNIDYFDGKDGLNGMNATDEQVQTAVDKYFKKNPPKAIHGKDGKDGKDAEKPKDGLTPEIRCNSTKNRWEVRYGADESWQALNGQVVMCTLINEEE